MREKAFQVSSTFLYVVYGLSPFQVYQDFENCKIIFLSNKLRWIRFLGYKINLQLHYINRKFDTYQTRLGHTYIRLDLK